MIASDARKFEFEFNNYYKSPRESDIILGLIIKTNILEFNYFSSDWFKYSILNLRSKSKVKINR